jgi:hypothetical protein
MQSDYYVYVLFDRQGLPYYVGKGRGHRLSRHPDVPKVKVREGLSNEAALKIERAFIFALGRRPDGLLINKNYGGAGFVDWSADHREMMRQRMLGKQYALGYRHTPVTIEKIRAESAGRKYPTRKPAKWSHPMSEQQRAAMSKRETGRKRSAEDRAKISAGMIGHEVLPETRAKIGKAHAGKKLSTTTIAKLRKVSGDNTRGKVWITDGSVDRRVAPDEVISEGWRRGRTTKPSSERMSEVATAMWARRRAAQFVTES